MGTDTKIEWADHTWNPWYGCTLVSEGCANCYALRRMTQLKRVAGPGDIRRASKAVQRFPLSKKVKPGDRVFVCSWGDFFHEDVPDEWRDDAFAVMHQRKDVIFLLLTKRPGRMARYLKSRDAWLKKEPIPKYESFRLAFPHIWLGFTAENQARFDERWPIMNSIDWPGKKFVSYEPGLGPVVLPAGFGLHNVTIDGRTMRAVEDSRRVLDWVIAGGESGPNARPAHPDWFRGLRDQCVEASVPFFFKQWGEWAPSPGARWHHHKLARMYDGWELPAHEGRILRDVRDTHHFEAAKADGKVFRVRKKRAGRVLDGRTWEQIPR